MMVLPSRRHGMWRAGCRDRIFSRQSAPVPKLTGHVKLKLLMDNTTSKGVIEDGTQLQSYIRCVRCRACFLFSQAFRRLGNMNSLVSAQVSMLCIAIQVQG